MRGRHLTYLSALLLTTLNTAVAQSTTCVEPPAGIVSWWPGEDDALDIVGSNHGVPLNGTSFVAGLVGRAFSFDGTDDYVEVPHDDSIFFSDSQPFTVEGWFRPSSESRSYFILKNAGYGLRWQGSSSPMLFYNGNNHFSAKTNWELGRWYHLALVDDGATSVKLYIDGTLDKSEDGLLRNPNRFPCRPGYGYCFSLQFGAWYEPEACGGGGTCNQFFRGSVDEVTVYSRALTADEVRGIYLLGSLGKCGGEGGPGDSDGDGFAPPEDCDDSDASVFPGAAEVYDARDNDCDQLVDEGLDDDGDGVPNFYDACNDTPAAVGVGPDGCPVVCFLDGDGDGYSAAVDCDDGNPSVHPGAPEICNEIDDDCDGKIDDAADSQDEGNSVCEDNDDDDQGDVAPPVRRELRQRVNGSETWPDGFGLAVGRPGLRR